MSPNLVHIRRAGAARPPSGPAADPTAGVGYESPRERGVDFSAVVAATAGRDPHLVLEPPEWDSPPSDLGERVWRALHEIPDPEFPISLADLGLVYGVDVEAPTGGDESAAARVTVTITLTATACPCVDFIKWDIRDRVLREPGVASVTVHITWDPPWTTDRVTERGREALRRAGVSI